MSGERKTKKAVYSWNRSQNRRVQFEPGKKLGLVLGKNCVIIKVRSNTPAYWKGIQEGSRILKINKMVCEEITIKSMLQAAVESKKPFVILLKVPPSPVKTEKIEVPESLKHGLPKGSTTIVYPNSQTSGDIKSSTASSSTAQVKLIKKNQPTANVTIGESTCSIDDEKESDCAVLQNNIKMLKQANLELQQKCSAEVLKRKEECMKRDAKIAQLERQIHILQNERNVLRRQINKKKTTDKQKHDNQASTRGLQVISETEVNKPLPSKSTFNKLKRAQSIPFSIDESVQSADVWYGNPTKDKMQAMWKDAKRDVKRLDSIASTTFGVAIAAPFEDPPSISISRMTSQVTDYTDSPWSSTPGTEFTQFDSMRDIGARERPSRVVDDTDAEPSVIFVEGDDFE